jgi:glucosamine--fructose-6-phosphate aminotransferase (isomerizing)
VCGIVGYAGGKQALPLLIDSLERVTYRGYDSFGVAILGSADIESFHQVGPVDAMTGAFNSAGQVGIGHTRWATIGGVSERNAHPHFDCTRRFAIVHNGDIDNFQALRARLLLEGHGIKSETDSELIAHLVEKYFDGDLRAAVERASLDLEGCYAVAVLCHATGEIAVVRESSPVVLGIGENEVFIASDAPAIIGNTNRVLYPEDGDVAIISNGSVKMFHGGHPVERPIRTLDWDASRTGKGSYEHFMLKEMHEQPQAIRDTLSAYASGLPALPVERPGNVIMLACGTSYHAALFGEDLLARLAKVSATARVASEFDTERPVPANSLIVALSQSGETADTLNAVRALKASGKPVIGITNVPESNLARESDATIYTMAGPEVAVAATKTFTTQLTALALLAARFGDQALFERVSRAARKLPSLIEGTLERSNEIAAVGNWLGGFDDMFIIAKGANYPVALEAALKLKEVAYIHAEGVPAGELKHGPFALLGSETPVLAIVADDAHRVRTVTAMREIAARGAPIITVTDRRDPEIEACSRYIIELPADDGIFTPIVFTVATQLLSYYAAKARGCPIDRPRNLAKSVTVP